MPDFLIKRVGTILFGSGWMRLWYGFHYLLLVPVWGLYAYCRDFRPGGGPQGGEAIMLFVLLLGATATGVGAVNALILVARSRLAWWRRFLAWPLALVLFPVVATFFGVAMVDAATGADFTSGGRLRIAIALPLLILTYYGLNFAALAQARK